MESATITTQVSENLSENSEENHPKAPSPNNKMETNKRAEVWRPIDTIRKNHRLLAMDYAVREQVKKQLTAHLSLNMDTLVEKGLTYDELIEIQKELELCPSVLEYYPGKQSWWTRLWQKFSFSIGLF